MMTMNTVMNGTGISPIPGNTVSMGHSLAHGGDQTLCVLNVKLATISHLNPTMMTMFCEDCTRRDVILLDDAPQNGLDHYWIEIMCLDCNTMWKQSWPEDEELSLEVNNVI